MRKKVLMIVLIAAIVCSFLGLSSFAYAMPSVANPSQAEGNPVQANWEGVQSYAMTTVTPDTTGATGSVKFLTVGSNFYVQLTVEDPTSYKGKDGVYIKIVPQVGGKIYESRGNYDLWLAPINNTLGELILLEQTSTAASDGESGTYVMNFGFDLGEAFVPGRSVNVTIKHRDCQDGSAWADGDYAHTLVYSDYVTLKYEMTDLAAQPTSSDWDAADTFTMLQNNSETTGATGTIKFLTVGSNFYFKLEVNDPTMYYNKDGLYIHFGTVDGTHGYKARGNYDNWLASLMSDYNQPVLLEQTLSQREDGKAGTYTFILGYNVGDDYSIGGNLLVDIRHRDCQDGSGWADNDYEHTIYYRGVLTFGEPADTTIRPIEENQSFVPTISGISYNKAVINWQEIESAEIYSIFVYKANGNDAEEPYEHLATEGPIYAGNATHSEEIFSLVQSTGYAIQVVAYKNDMSVITASKVVEFTTISRDEADNNNDDDENNDEEETPAPKKKGCSNSVAALMTIIFAAGCVSLSKKF